ncbi:probable serine/threonine-protein kinase roco11 [Musca domestica]|uniref:Probable serine/threonine-protein kinase roco11 n=1 Tax=Musca domestica TaxID=7370 RepID=A0ABM3UV99_MUSDO|nr:probable serine/threonine-protein kinase roco11 [Musca domestica]
MLTLGTHKIYKITSLTIDSYKQLFAVITMLLTVLSVQQSNAAFAMAVPVRASVSTSSSSSSSPSAPPASAPSQAVQDLSVLASVPVQQHNLLQHHTKHLHSSAPLTRMQHGHLQHPEAQLNLLLDNTNNNNNNNINNNHHNNANHHHYEHQSETDIATEERLLHKRHTSWHDLYDQTMNSNDIVWYNPCGGHYVNINDSKTAKKKSPMKKTLRKLQNATVIEYNSLNVRQLAAIDIRNMSMWNKYDEKYKFLPQIEIPSNISLRRCHRQMQTYVAAFDYLHRAQLDWDYNKGMQQSQTSRELLSLRNNARSILCNIEHAVNNTTSKSKADRTINSLLISRRRMEKLLQFDTDIKKVSPLRWNKNADINDNNLKHISPIDLKFVKSRYLTYLRKFIKLLRRTTNRMSVPKNQMSKTSQGSTANQSGRKQAGNGRKNQRRQQRKQ